MITNNVVNLAMKQRTHLKMHWRNQFLAGCVFVDAVLTPELRDPSTLALAVPGCTKAHNHTTTTVRKKPARNVHWQHPVTPILDHTSYLFLIFPKIKQDLMPVANIGLVPSHGAPC